MMIYQKNSISYIRCLFKRVYDADHYDIKKSLYFLVFTKNIFKSIILFQKTKIKKR